MTTPDNTQADQYTATVKEPINDPVTGGYLPHIDGYDSRADVPIGEFQRPNLWHLAQAIGETGKIPAKARHSAKADILNTWGALADFQALALKQETMIRNLQAGLAMLTGPCYCAANENHPGVCRGADCNCHGEPGPRTDDDEPADEDAREQAAWQAVFGSMGHVYEWFRQITYVEPDTNWETPGTVTIMAENPNDETKTITKTLDAADLVRAYDQLRAAGGGTHCGTCDLIDDPDDCSSDLLLQQAMYGEIVYG